MLGHCQSYHSFIYGLFRWSHLALVCTLWIYWGIIKAITFIDLWTVSLGPSIACLHIMMNDRPVVIAFWFWYYTPDTNRWQERPLPHLLRPLCPVLGKLNTHCGFEKLTRRVRLRAPRSAPLRRPRILHRTVLCCLMSRARWGSSSRSSLRFKFPRKVSTPNNQLTPNCMHKVHRKKNDCISHINEKFSVCVRAKLQ
jgi:hypothetical protein